MTGFELFWIAAAGLAITCLTTIGIRSLAQFSPHELKEISRRRNAPNRIGQILRWREQVSMAVQTLRMIAMAAFVGAGTIWAWSQWHVEGQQQWLLLSCSVLVSAGLLLVTGIWIPWTVARLWAGPFLYVTWPIWWALSFPLLPLAMIARMGDVAVHRLAGRTEHAADEEAFEEDIRTIVSEGHREGLLEEDAREMIEGVIELGDVVVSEIMTPRTDMVSLSAAIGWPEMLDIVIKAGHSRIPVYGRNRDDILGILYAKDLLAELAKPPQDRAEPWTKLLREAMFVPETKPTDTLLQELQQNRNHLAVVLDEYGGVSGLVTIEDVLEEIVGEIVDEYDTALVDGIREVSPGVFEISGRVHIDEINERLHLKLPEDADYDTIGGFVFGELGHVPVADEQLIWQTIRITVLEATRRRIERVRIEPFDVVDAT